MSAKQMKYEGDARQAILNGVSKLAQAVATTLGPSGRNVIIDKKHKRRQSKQSTWHNAWHVVNVQKLLATVIIKPRAS